MVGYEIMLLANVHKGSAKWQSDHVSTSIISLYTFFRFFSSSEFKYRTALQGLKQNKLQLLTVNQQILAAIKFGISQNKVIYVNLAAIKFGVSPRPVYVVYDRRICWRRQILAKTRNSPNSPNIIARQNLLIYSNWQIYGLLKITAFGITKLSLRKIWHALAFM